jgi:hypothetical protein
MPPIKCTPCRVTYDGQRYQIESNGSVRLIPNGPGGILMTAKAVRLALSNIEAMDENTGRLIRREASRQRRNRNARERNQVMRDIGLIKTPYGWE